MTNIEKLDKKYEALSEFKLMKLIDNGFKVFFISILMAIFALFVFLWAFIPNRIFATYPAAILLVVCFGFMIVAGRRLYVFTAVLDYRQNKRRSTPQSK